MNIPNFVDSQFVDKDGTLTDSWKQILTQLFTEMQNNVSNEGVIIPSQKTTDIEKIITDTKNKGAIIYDEITNQPKININGAIKVLQTAGNDFNTDATGLSYDPLTATLSLNINYVIPTTTEASNWNTAYNESVNLWHSPLSFSLNEASIQQANSSQNGYLSSIDWISFNSKEPAISLGTINDYWRGDKTFQNLNSDVRLALSSSATGLAYTNTTGVFSLTSGYVIPTTIEESNWNDAYSKRVNTWTAPLQFSSNTASITQSGVSSNGFLSSTDWNTFNNKQNALTNPVTGTGTSGQYAEFNGTTTLTGVTKNTAFNVNFETLTTNIKPNGTVNVGALSTVARADHIHALSADSPITYNSTTGAISYIQRSVFCPAETSSAYNGRRARLLSGAGTININFFIPKDFNSLVSAELVFYVSAGAAGPSKNIDLTVEYTNAANQLYNQFSSSDTTTLYNLTGYTDRQYRLPFSSLLLNVVAGTEGGLNINNNAIGGNIYVIGIYINYT